MTNNNAHKTWRNEMKRITGKYGKIIANTDSCLKLDGIDYRLGGHEWSLVCAVDHDKGIVIKTDFFETDDFEPIKYNGKEFRSDYHDMVLDMISESIHRDEIDNAAEDAYAERLHP